MWHRTRDERWLRLTHFFGTLFLINFAIGVATGLVQEFEFGMNWSVYSKFVGNVFGAPLAMEGLAAFMLEATFLGLWIFGWNRLSPRVHLATCGCRGRSWLSAFFILVANSWMQRPVGSRSRTASRADEHLGAAVQRFRPCRLPAHVILVGLTSARSSCWASAAGTSCAAQRRGLPQCGQARAHRPVPVSA